MDPDDPQEAHGDEAQMTEDMVTQEQLDELAESIKPVVRMIIGARPGQVLSIKVTCKEVLDHPGVHVLHWEMKLDGEDLSPEQEKKVAELLRVADSATKALFSSPVQAPKDPIKP